MLFYSQSVSANDSDEHDKIMIKNELLHPSRTKTTEKLPNDKVAQSHALSHFACIISALHNP